MSEICTLSRVFRFVRNHFPEMQYAYILLSSWAKECIQIVRLALAFFEIIDYNCIMRKNEAINTNSLVLVYCEERPHSVSIYSLIILIYTIC